MLLESKVFAGRPRSQEREATQFCQVAERGVVRNWQPPRAHCAWLTKRRIVTLDLLYTTARSPQAIS
jgi:hypothetical protein